MGHFVARAAGVLLLLLLPALAQAATRYVSDQIPIVLRDAPRGDAGARGVLTSGARVEVLETDSASGFARVRAADGREGWVPERFLAEEPAAHGRVERLEKQLADAQAELKKLKEDHGRLLQDFQRISRGEPVASKDVLRQAADLRAQLARKDEEAAALRQRYDAQRTSRRTLLLGGALVAGGFVLALLLRWLWPAKRRWGDF